MSFIGDVTKGLSDVAGMATPLGAIAGGISAVKGLFGNPSGDSMALAEKQHQWDVEENQRNRDFQREEWQRQFDAINSYNNPSATAERLRKAGLNATAILNGQGSAIGQSSGSPSAPSGAHGLNAMPDVVSQVGFQSQESIFKRLEMLGNLSKSAALLPETKAKLAAEVENVLSDTNLKDVRVDVEKFMLDLDRLFKPSERWFGLSRQQAEIAKAYAEMKLAIKNGEKIDEEKLNLAIERLLIDARKNLTQAEYDTVKKQFDWIDIEKKQAIKESKSRESSYYAGANKANAEAKTENELRESRKLALDLSNELQSLEKDFNSETFKKRVESFVNQVGLSKWALLSSEMEYKDRNAYNALQRLMLGKGSSKDGVDVIRFLRNHSTEKFDINK